MPGAGLVRFVDAQATVYDIALRELREGRKTSHWMWYIFPQLASLDRSQRAVFYGLADAAEARAYQAHPVLGPRLNACFSALLGLQTDDAEAVLGAVDALKLRSCATLFQIAAPGTDTARRAGDVLRRFYGGQPCLPTRQELAGEGRN